MISLQCETCQRLRPDGVSCAAFPDGIPTEILRGQWDHTEPIQGDHGLQWLADPTAGELLEFMEGSVEPPPGTRPPKPS